MYKESDRVKSQKTPSIEADRYLAMHAYPICFSSPSMLITQQTSPAGLDIAIAVRLFRIQC